MQARTRYTRSGDVDLAYQVVGDGPLDVVWVPGFVSHVEMFWELPGFGDAWRRIAIRVAGSWVAASGLLLLGWTLRAT